MAKAKVKAGTKTGFSLIKLGLAVLIVLNMALTVMGAYYLAGKGCVAFRNIMGAVMITAWLGNTLLAYLSGRKAAITGNRCV